jgi:capsular polysaccharide biosynthesis protein
MANKSGINRMELNPTDKQENISGNPNSKIPIHYYAEIIKSSLWVIAILAALCIGIAYLISKRITPMYQVSTTIYVSKTNFEQSSDYDTVLILQNFTENYAHVITSESILNQVRTSFNIDISTEELRKAIDVSYIDGTQIIEIHVEHTNPELAVNIANKLVAVFSSSIEEVQLESIVYQEDDLKSQLNDIETEINQLNKKIYEHSLQLYNQRLDKIKASISDIKKQIEQTNQELAPLQTKLTLTESQQLEFSNIQTRREELYSLLYQYQDELVSLTVQGPTLDSQDIESRQNSALLDQNQHIYLNLLQKYQTSKASNIQNSVTVTQVDQPFPPKKPVRPNLTVNLVLGCALGLILATLYIYFMKLGV